MGRGVTVIIKYCDWIISFQTNIYKVFNNRELALAFWMLMVAIYCFSTKKIRIPLLAVVKIAFCRKFIIAYLCMSAYTGLIVYVLYAIGFWDVTLFKDTMMWFLFTGIISAFRAVDKAKDFNYFKTIVKDYIKIILLLEFIVNFYTFSFLGELVFIPFIIILTMCCFYLDVSPEFQNEKSEPIKKLFRFINIIIGVFIICHAILLAINDFDTLQSINTLQCILLPPILSTAFLGFIYLFALWISYEQIFVRIEFGEEKSKKLIAYIKFKIILLCKFNLSRVDHFGTICRLELMNIKSKTDVIEVLSTYKKYIGKE